MKLFIFHVIVFSLLVQFFRYVSYLLTATALLLPHEGSTLQQVDVEIIFLSMITVFIVSLPLNTTHNYTYNKYVCLCVCALLWRITTSVDCLRKQNRKNFALSCLNKCLKHLMRNIPKAIIAT